MTEKDDSAPLTRDIAPFGLRMPPDMKAQIKQSAEANNRSLNAEIVSAIKFYLDFDSLNETPRRSIVHTANLDEQLFVNSAKDVENVVARLTEKYSRDLTQAMLEMLKKPQEEDQ